MRFSYKSYRKNILFLNRYIIDVLGINVSQNFYDRAERLENKMVRIKINPKKQSDVNEMKAKGWAISVYRDRDTDSEFVTIEKGRIRFVMKTIIDENTNDKYVEVKKYMDGYVKDAKRFYENGYGVNGTFVISEGKTPDMTYAFFRNEGIQEIIDRYGLNRIVFPKEQGEKFDKTVYLDITKNPTSNDKNAPFFHTDGTYKPAKSDNKNLIAFDVSNASYIYEYNTFTLTIPWKYDLEKIDEIMASLTE